MRLINQLTDFREPLIEARQAGHRLMLVLAVDEERGVSLLQQFSPVNASFLCIDMIKQHQIQLSAHQHISASQTKQFLGVTNQCVVYNAHRSFNASALCAASGTIMGGGVLILLTPSLAQWQQNFDAQLQAYGQLKAKAHSYFIQWWQQQWQAQSAVYVLTQDARQPQDEMIHAHWQALPQQPLMQAHSPIATAAQEHLIEQLVAAYKQQSKQVFAIDAHRGRGKTACLGWLIKAINQDAKHGPVLVTAPSKRALVSMMQTAGPGPINFYALDKLLNKHPEAGMLIVDEAASVPLAQITKLIKHYPLLVLSSTQDGYEGSGQGYRLKLPRIIKHLATTSKALTLKDPMRWKANDPLETFIRSSFLCDVNLTDTTNVKQISCELPLSYSEITGEKLSQDTKLLAQVYALLMLAHYQTTPQDLRLLLDHPAHKVYLCHAGDCLVGLAWVAQEGGLEASLASQIAQGRRRIQGHLLAQILAQQAGFPIACEMRSWRIQRLVVLPTLQGRGIGSSLLEEVYQCAGLAGVDFVGASFAASADTLRFWQANQFSATWLGLRADASTGLNSVQVMRPISSVAKNLTQQLRCHFRDYLNFGKQFWFNSVDVDTSKLISFESIEPIPKVLKAEQRQCLLRLLAQGQAGFCGPLYLLHQQLPHEKDKQLVMKAAQNNTHKSLQTAVRQLALSLLG